jgi:hypothetical protein
MGHREPMTINAFLICELIFMSTFLTGLINSLNLTLSIESPFSSILVTWLSPGMMSLFRFSVETISKFQLVPDAYRIDSHWRADVTSMSSFLQSLVFLFKKPTKKIYMKNSQTPRKISDWKKHRKDEGKPLISLFGIPKLEEQKRTKKKKKFERRGRISLIEKLRIWILDCTGSL